MIPLWEKVEMDLCRGMIRFPPVLEGSNYAHVCRNLNDLPLILLLEEILHQLVLYPIIYRVFILGGAGFVP